MGMLSRFVIYLWLAVTQLALLLAGREKLPCAETMVEAARLHEEAAALIRAEKIRRNVEISEEDILGIGLMGIQFSAITTTTAGVAEKRTAQLPDFAALMVKYFTEAGLQAGDRVGANFSGSYPGLNLAVICAAQVMELELVYSSSVGSSAYGANIPQYTFPEMLKTLHEAGLIRTMPGMITLGGGGDMGRNMMGYILEEPEEIEEMIRRLEGAGLGPEKIESYSQDIALHEALYGEIKAFVNVGGNSLGLGGNDAIILSIGAGLLEPRNLEINGQSGLVERYLARGIPTIHLLDVKGLCRQEGICFDPAIRVDPGLMPLYYGERYEEP